MRKDGNLNPPLFHYLRRLNLSHASSQTKVEHPIKQLTGLNLVKQLWQAHAEGYNAKAPIPLWVMWLCYPADLFLRQPINII